MDKLLLITTGSPKGGGGGLCFIAPYLLYLSTIQSLHDGLQGVLVVYTIKVDCTDDYRPRLTEIIYFTKCFVLPRETIEGLPLLTVELRQVGTQVEYI
jgi:hypothetical protein